MDSFVPRLSEVGRSFAASTAAAVAAVAVVIAVADDVGYVSRLVNGPVYRFVHQRRHGYRRPHPGGARYADLMISFTSQSCSAFQRRGEAGVHPATCALDA